jgi:hypothetical protein
MNSSAEVKVTIISLNSSSVTASSWLGCFSNLLIKMFLIIYNKVSWICSNPLCLKVQKISLNLVKSMPENITSYKLDILYNILFVNINNIIQEIHKISHDERITVMIL